MSIMRILPTLIIRKRAAYFSRLLAGNIMKFSRCSLVFILLKMLQGDMKKNNMTIAARNPVMLPS